MYQYDIVYFSSKNTVYKSIEILLQRLSVSIHNSYTIYYYLN